MKRRSKRETWTFEPDGDVKSLVSKQASKRFGRGTAPRGFRSELLNEALRAYLSSLRGKQEGNLA